ncbi:hypothetical protein AWB78_07374 [Caballeronia calidae]|uniref:Uncharacterized protein n=1 Tax=Caballeronia calidae TaxID=1777139 RepID=A0A158EEB8_9BURK|nr:hypothetical protein [Caballeronia calidae]SAL05231.1 hypothetical protein AWB78_07374 [Caballeronia calidae]
MGFVILPLVAVLFWFGLTMQASQLANAVPGAGPAGRMESLAAVSAQQAEMFGSACASTALASPGVVTTGMTVILPTGVALPGGAVCMTISYIGNGRNVYGYLPVSPGAIGIVLSDTQDNAVWYRVQSAGVAVNLATGETASIPSTIPVGDLVDWIQTSS